LVVTGGQGVGCGLDRDGKPGDLRGSGHSKAHVPSEPQNTTSFRRYREEKDSAQAPGAALLWPRPDSEGSDVCEYRYR
jgi:hypothetical protein